MKYERVLEWFKEVEGVLEGEDFAVGPGVIAGVGESAGGGGQWSRRRREVEREVRRRVPDFQVVVAMGQHAGATAAAVSTSTSHNAAKPNETQAALLAESSTRLLWLYNRCLPSLVAEARFDVGKLLQHLVPSSTSMTNEEGEVEISSIAGLKTLRQLHVLRLLKENEGFSWTGKTGMSIPILS